MSKAKTASPVHKKGTFNDLSGNGGGPAPDRCVTNNFGKHECHNYPIGPDELATCPSEEDGETICPSDYVHETADVLAKCHTD